ncbi:unnamed protein product [Xylocopa violacea]|uniref:Uncharacterized protein n=1 Tax=Xylocopa violacea TaxID=135666 RepID=A0ABP1NX53_XYLVO
MSNCCSCIRGCTVDAYQPLSSQRFGHQRVDRVKIHGRETLAIRSPRNQRRKLSVRYDAVRPAGVASQQLIKPRRTEWLLTSCSTDSGMRFNVFWMTAIAFAIVCFWAAAAPPAPAADPRTTVYVIRHRRRCPKRKLHIVLINS